MLLNEIPKVMAVRGTARDVEKRYGICRLVGWKTAKPYVCTPKPHGPIGLVPRKKPKAGLGLGAKKPGSRDQLQGALPR